MRNIQAVYIQEKLGWFRVHIDCRVKISGLVEDESGGELLILPLTIPNE